MKIVSKLGICPVSLNVIDSVIRYSNEHQAQLMLVASRNQIDTDGGYVGFTSKEFVDYVRKQSNIDTIVICRDHSGSSVTSVGNDITAGFDLIHIDCSDGDVYKATKHLLEEFGKYEILFEVGTEENTGISTSLSKFRTDLEFITKIIQPEFIVGNTGSLVKESYQVGFFDYETVKELVSIAHSFGIKFKEHNVDYSSLTDLRQRKNVGIDAINIGPELGVTQTKIIIGLARQYGLFKELDVFLNYSLKSRRWEKWIYNAPSDFQKAVIAGHYVYTSNEYRELVDKLNKEADVNYAVNEGIIFLLNHYLGGLK